MSGLGLKEHFDALGPVILPFPLIHYLCPGTFSIAIRACILKILLLLRPTLRYSFKQIQETDPIGEYEDVDPEDAEEGVELVEARVICLNVLGQDYHLNYLVADQVHCVD